MKKLGFTLIELLIVIAIIGIMITVGSISYLTTQKQARNSARHEIIGNIQSAFEIYFAENGIYPSNDPGLAFQNGTVPLDPKGSIIWNVDSDQYCVCATLEDDTGNAESPGTSTQCTWSQDDNYYCAQNQQ